jgi:hypothetical protein
MMKDMTMLLLEEQAARYTSEQVISMVREELPDIYHTHWFVCGEGADWVGFMDDQGDFIPVDWC